MFSFLEFLGDLEAGAHNLSTNTMSDRSCFCPSPTGNSGNEPQNQATNMEPNNDRVNFRQDQQEDQPPSWKETEKMLAEAMATLSVEERNAAMDDLHGIRSEAAAALDDRATYTAKLQAMVDYMEAHPNQAYELAKERESLHGPQSVSVSDTEFHSYFLKSTDSGQAEDAAKKMLSFLEQKLELFGEEALCRPITMKDLTEDDIECLEQGFFQDLGKDSSGRQLIGCLPSQHTYKSVASFLRATYYFMMSTFPERNHPDRHGVTVFYGNGMPPRQSDLSGDFQLTKRALKLTVSIPMKICASHITLDPNFVDPTILFCIKLSKRKARYKIHLGSHMEVHYELRRYGITGIPVDLQGQLSLHFHRRWIQHRQAIDGCLSGTPKEIREEYLRLVESEDNRGGYIKKSSMDDAPPVPARMAILDPGGGLGSARVARSEPQDSLFMDLRPEHVEAQLPAKPPACLEGKIGTDEIGITPTPNDVLFGRGMHTQRHAGNIKFRAVLEKNLSSYVNAANDMEKVILVDTLCHQLITNFNVRFLKQSSQAGSTVWVLQEDRKAIHAKFSQTFRSIKAAKSKKQQQQQQQT